MTMMKTTGTRKRLKTTSMGTITNPMTQMTPKKTTRSPTIVMLLALALFGAACSGGDDGSESTTTAGSTDTTSAAQSTTTTVAEDLDPSDVITLAVDELLDAGSYAFDATIEVTLQGDTAESELEGWVDGADRELTLKLGGEQVTTRVIDGVATVERDGETIEVPLAEAGNAPSLEILKGLRQIESESDNEITGALDAAALGASGFDVNGTAIVTVTLSADGSLSGYTMIAKNGSWSVEARFFDVGESFSS
jgi:hypothetical protein